VSVDKRGCSISFGPDRLDFSSLNTDFFFYQQDGYLFYRFVDNIGDSALIRRLEREYRKRLEANMTKLDSPLSKSQKNIGDSSLTMQEQEYRKLIEAKSPKLESPAATSPAFELTKSPVENVADVDFGNADWNGARTGDDDPASSPNPGGETSTSISSTAAGIKLQPTSSVKIETPTSVVDNSIVVKGVSGAHLDKDSLKDDIGELEREIAELKKFKLKKEARDSLVGVGIGAKETSTHDAHVSDSMTDTQAQDLRANGVGVGRMFTDKQMQGPTNDLEKEKEGVYEDPLLFGLPMEAMTAAGKTVVQDEPRSLEGGSAVKGSKHVAEQTSLRADAAEMGGLFEDDVGNGNVFENGGGKKAERERGSLFEDPLSPRANGGECAAGIENPLDDPLFGVLTAEPTTPPLGPTPPEVGETVLFVDPLLGVQVETRQVVDPLLGVKVETRQVVARNGGGATVTTAAAATRKAKLSKVVGSLFDDDDTDDDEHSGSLYSRTAFSLPPPPS
jgi:hypothetical protein